MNYFESPSKWDPEKERESFELFLKEVKSNVRKGKYKKVLEDIEVGEQKYSHIFLKWQILDIKISTLFKAFLKFLYHNDLSIMKDHITVDGHLSKIDKNVEEWLDYLFIYEDRVEESHFNSEFDNLITAYITQLYAYALLSKRERKCGDTCAYLGIAEKLIKFFSEKTKNNKFLFISSQVYLFISSLLIADEEYLTAEVYQKQALCLAFRLLTYLNFNNDYLDLTKMRKSNRAYCEKAIITICIAFYHRGNCEETLGNIVKANESYSQAKWFSSQFLISSYPELAQFLDDVYARVSKDAKMWLKAQKQGSLKPPSKQVKKPVEMDKVNELEELKDQFKDTIKRIEQLKFPEFDEDRRHTEHGLHEILYTLRMTNFLMSDELKSLVTDLEKINVHKMDKDTKEKINKKLVQIRAKASYERYCNAINEQDENKNKKNTNTGPRGSESKFNLYRGLEPVSSVPRFSLGQNTTSTPKLNNLQLYINNSAASKEKDKFCTGPIGINVKNLTSDNTKNKDLNLLSMSFRKAALQTEISSTSNKEYELVHPDEALNFIQTVTTDKEILSDSERKETYRKTNKVFFLSEPADLSLNFKKSYTVRSKKVTKKYNYNKFIFNDSYQDKLKALNANFNKELNFQKQLLRLKKNEKIYVEEIDFKKKSKEYNLKFIKKIKEDRKKFVKKKEIKQKKSDNVVGKLRFGKQRNKVEQIVLKSLDSRQLGLLRSLRREREEDRVTLREEFQLKHNIEERLEHEQLINETKEKLTNVEKEMDLIEKIEKQNLKKIHPVIYKDRPISSRKPVTDRSKREYNENFTKVQSDKKLTSTFSVKGNVFPRFKNFTAEDSEN